MDAIKERLNRMSEKEEDPARDEMKFTKNLRDRVLKMSLKDELTNGDLIFLDLLYEHMSGCSESAK